MPCRVHIKKSDGGRVFQCAFKPSMGLRTQQIRPTLDYLKPPGKNLVDTKQCLRFFRDCRGSFSRFRV